MGRAWKLGRIGGIPLYADPSITIVAALLSFNLWLAFSDQARFPGLSQGVAVALSISTAVLFLLSILAHELAHAGMFRARGIRVKSITIYMLGGVTQALQEPASPADEFLTTVVGPATTAALGGLFLALHLIGRTDFSHPLRAMFGYLALVNLLMAGFNLLPGFPLDGGRLLLAGLWRATGDRYRAMHMAARVGQVVAAGIIALGVVLGIQRGDILFGVWPALIGWFLFRSATAAILELESRTMLRTATAGQVMSAPPPTVPADIPVSVATERYLLGHDGEAFPVMDDGHVVGFVSLRTAAPVPLDRPVREAMAGAGGVVESSPEESMEAVAARLRERSSQTVMVVQGGRLVGVIERDDLNRFFRGGRGGRSSARIPPRPDSAS